MVMRYFAFILFARAIDAQITHICADVGGKFLVRSGSYPTYLDEVVECGSVGPNGLVRETGLPYTTFPPVYSIFVINDGVLISLLGTESCNLALFSYCDTTGATTGNIIAVPGALFEPIGLVVSFVLLDFSELAAGVTVSGNLQWIIELSSPLVFDFALVATNTKVTVSIDIARSAGGARSIAQGHADAIAAGARGAAGAGGVFDKETRALLADAAVRAATGGSLHDALDALAFAQGGDRSSTRATVSVSNNFGMFSLIVGYFLGFTSTVVFTPDSSTSPLVRIDEIISVGDPPTPSPTPADCPACVRVTGGATPKEGSSRFVFMYGYPCNYTCTSASQQPGEFCRAGTARLRRNETNATACVAGASGVVTIPCGLNVTTGEILCLPLPTAGVLTQAGLDVTVAALSRGAAAAEVAAAVSGSGSARAGRRASDDGTLATREVLRVFRESGLGYAEPSQCGGCRFVFGTATPTPYGGWGDASNMNADGMLTSCGLCGAFLNGTAGSFGVLSDNDGVSDYLSAQFVVCLGDTSAEQTACLGAARCNGFPMGEECVVSGMYTVCPTVPCPSSSGSKKGLLGLLGLLGLIPLLCCSAIVCCLVVFCSRRRKANATFVPTTIVGDGSLIPMTITSADVCAAPCGSTQGYMGSVGCGPVYVPTCVP